VGPDFIDPGHHTAVTGAPSYNLDGWMLGRDYNQRSFACHLAGKEVGVVEGVMGLFDGYSGKSEAGSTAEMAKWLGLPVILVVDASAMARSVAALVHGFHSFDPDLNLAGVVFNRIGGPGHLRYLQEALEEVPGITILGGLPGNNGITIPERHLGLMTQEEHRLTPQRIDQLVSLVEENLDLSRLLQMSEVRDPGGEKVEKLAGFRGSGKRVRFGVARDAAFCFYYPDNLELLEAAGAEVVFFSPLRDQRLPENVQGLYFGGGYPEVQAGLLAANGSMRQGVRDFVEQGRLVYAECGGFMYLTQGIRNVGGTFFPMVGVYPAVVRMLPRLSALGYIEAEISASSWLSFAGKVRGHEFHYSELETETFSRPGLEWIYQLRKGPNDSPRPEGYLYKRCLASYVHLHFGSNAEFAGALVESVRQS
jgi:cobyrinic acid a,c-diamide synthase